MGRSSRRWGAGWARISRQSLHKSLLIARSQNGPIRSLDISKFRTRPHPYPSLSNRSADRLESSSNFVPSDGLIFMQTFALTLFKHPPRPEPSAHAKFVYAQARKRRFSRLTVYKIRTLHPPPKKDLSPTPTPPAPRCGLPRCPGVLGCRGECSCRWHLRCASV